MPKEYSDWRRGLVGCLEPGNIGCFEQRLLQLEFGDVLSFLLLGVLDHLGASPDLPLKGMCSCGHQGLKGMLVKVAEKRQDTLVEIGSLVFESEESASHWFKSIGLDDGPLLDDLWIMFGSQKESDFGEFANCLVEAADLEDVQGFLGRVLLFSRAINLAVLESVDEGLELAFGLRCEEDERLLGGDDHDHLAVDGVQVFVGEDGLPG